MKNTLLLLISFFILSCNTTAQNKKKVDKKTYPISKTEKEWKEILTPQQFYVLRQAGTERPFTSKYNKNYEEGTYVCAACKTPLFNSWFKFDSGTGWPSFDREIKGNVAYDVDYNLGYARTEEHCATCGGHLGHVFEDGPIKTTGKRHCINGVALEFIPSTSKDK